MRILITGGSGQLGRELQRLFTPGHMVWAPPRAELDLGAPRAVSRFITRLRPDLVLHAAAWTDVDGCEADPERAHRINADGTAAVAAACRAMDAVLLYVSTDFVFDGRLRRPYEESDEPNPINVYGATKLAGEAAVASVPRHFIVRTAWLFGPYGRNFPRTILRLAQAQPELCVVDDQVGSPTAAPDLAEAIRDLVQTEQYGTYHFANSGRCSWCEFARMILAAAGIERPVRPISSAELARPARRPPYSVLSTARITALLGRPPRSLHDVVGQYVPSLAHQPGAAS